MKLRKSQTTSGIERAVSKSVNFEVTIADIARRSERRAWLVAFNAILMSLILAGGYFYFLPLKEKVPFLVMADAYTGTSTVARLRDDFSNPSITTSEALYRSNIAHFILARESYDVAMLKLRDWRTVYTMSEPEVAVDYTRLHSIENPASPNKVYGRDRTIRVRILSITPIVGGKSATPLGATVRFQRSVYYKETGASEPLDSKIATLEFTYKSNLEMDEEDRIENPLGFRVTSYRVENDYAASPPLETQVLQAPTMPVTPSLESQLPAASVPSRPQPQDAVLSSGTPGVPAAGYVPSGGAAPVAAPAPETNNTNGASVR
ncbi:MAG: type IV secretion system protein [Luteimonas sp.]|nr:type IV secretion system protein [Luteimonas sp.]